MNSLIAGGHWVRKQGCLTPPFVVWMGIVLMTEIAGQAAEQNTSETSFAERLGWSERDVVIILHVDDVGMAHASNRGAIESMENGVASSFSLMMPCPWIPEMAHYLKDHPEADSGLHLTLTSEWKKYRWPPLSGAAQVPGLVDAEDCLWHTVAQVMQKASADEVEREIRAQIHRAERLGINITHLDSHMGTLFARPDYFER